MWPVKQERKENYFDILGLPIGEYNGEAVSEATKKALANAKRLPIPERHAEVTKILDTFAAVTDGIGSDYVDSVMSDANSKNHFSFGNLITFIRDLGASINYFSTGRAEEIGDNFKVFPHRGKALVKSVYSQPLHGQTRGR